MTDETLAIYGHQIDKEGLWAFFDAYVHAPEDAAVAIRSACPEGHPDIHLLVLSVDHAGIDEITAMVSVAQARAFMEMLAGVSAKHPNEAEAMGLGRLQAGLGDVMRQLEVGRVHRSQSGCHAIQKCATKTL